MAISITNSQGTKIWTTAVPGTAWADCTAAITALQAGDQVGCPQSIGNLEEERTSTEYKCLSNNESAKSLGAISRGTIEIGMLFDPDDAEGQNALKTAFASNTHIMIGIELSDTGSTNGTMYYFEGAVSKVSTGIEQDAAVMYTATIEIASDITECPAA